MSVSHKVNGSWQKTAGLPPVDSVLSSTSQNPLENRQIYAALADKITASVSNLVNYYKKSETYTQAEVRQLIGAISTLSIKVVAALPTTDISATTIYWVGPDATTGKYDQYIYSNNTWVKTGDTSVNLGDYVTTEALELAIADFLTETEIRAILASYYTKTEIDTLLNGKQDSLTFDNVPTKNSTNVVKSGGVYSAVDDIYKVTGKNGAKNLISYPFYYTSRTINGVTFTDNGDGTVTVNGTASADSSFLLSARYGLSGDILFIPNGDYLVNGCIGGSNSTYFIQTSITSSGAFTILGKNYDGDTAITIAGDDSSESGAYIGNAIIVKSGTTVDNVTIKPMIRYADDTDDTYQPYAKDNRALTLDSATWFSNNLTGVKNLLRYPWKVSSTTASGLTFTDNGDGTVTVDGTASAATYYTMWARRTSDVADDCLMLPVGDYLVSGCTGGSSTTYHIQVGVTKNSTFLKCGDYNYDGTTLFDIPGDDYSETEAALQVQICVREGVVMDNVVFKPMIRVLGNSDDTFAPYAKTNKQLTDELSNFEENITGEVSDDEVYTMRQGKGNLADISNLVGGTVAWNQLVSSYNYRTDSTVGLTLATSTDGVGAKLTGTILAAPTNNQFGISTSIHLKRDGRKYLVLVDNGGDYWYGIIGYSPQALQNGGFMFTSDTGTEWVNGGVFLWIPSSRIGETISLDNIHVNIIDLTTMFGATIADYIYSLEQANAGDGVAWFRQYFPNAYYAYDAGSLQSVRPSGRKVIGKNHFKIIPGVSTSNGITCIRDADGSVTLNGTSTAWGFFNLNYVDYNTLSIPPGDYLLNGGVSNIEFRVYADSQRVLDDTNGINDAAFTIPATAKSSYIRIDIGNGRTFNNVKFYPMIRLATITDKTYESYNSTTYPFSPVDLRGIPKLVDNKLAYDGDIYYNNGSITRKYGIVDLGTLSWGKQTTAVGYRFTGYKPDLKPTASTTDLPDIICPKYTPDTSYNTWNRTNNKTIGINNGDSQTFLIVDTDYTDASALKTSLSGVYAVYPLSSRTMGSAPVFQSPQRAFSDGTEEWLDDRDMLIPVGHNTTYQLSDTLPIVEDYVEGACEQRVSYADNGVLGAKNLIPYPYYDGTSKTNAGITYTVNADGSITANGTATANSVFYLYGGGYGKLKDNFLKIGTYYRLTDEKPVGRSGIYVQWQTFSNQSGTMVEQGNSNTELFRLTANATYIRFFILINNGQTVDNVTFKPMLRLASDPDTTFQLYAMTNRELTEKEQIQDISSNAVATIGTLSSATYIKKIGNVIYFKINISGLNLSANTWTDVVHITGESLFNGQLCTVCASDAYMGIGSIENANDGILIKAKLTQAITNSFLLLWGTTVVQ